MYLIFSLDKLVKNGNGLMNLKKEHIYIENISKKYTNKK
jgi:hypothetical protein